MTEIASRSCHVLETFIRLDLYNLISFIITFYLKIKNKLFPGVLLFPQKHLSFACVCSSSQMTLALKRHKISDVCEQMVTSFFSLEHFLFTPMGQHIQTVFMQLPCRTKICNLSKFILVTDGLSKVTQRIDQHMLPKLWLPVDAEDARPASYYQVLRLSLNSVFTTKTLQILHHFM